MATNHEARDVIYEQVVRIAKVIENSGSRSDVQARALESLARAYRHAAGGPQPGGSGGSSE